MGTLQTHLLGNDAPNLARDLTVEGRGKAQPRREDRCADGHVSMRCLLCEKKRNTETRVLHHIFL